jgi:hypothetical protein
MLFVLKLIWASPWTLFGLFVGLIGLLTGGSAALTLGHVVIGRDPYRENMFEREAYAKAP